MCWAESNSQDDDDEEQTSSGCRYLDYFIHAKKRDQTQNKPIAGLAPQPFAQCFPILAPR
jgi:hypothetical protein